MRKLIVLLSCFLLVIGVQAQGEQDTCEADMLTQQQETFEELLSLDFANNPNIALSNLYRLGSVYQQLAIQCGYQPSDLEIEQLLELVLSITDLQTLIAATSTGNNMDELMTELETVRGNITNGQLLYNGLEVGLDGSAFGCSGCHQGEVAPALEGTWTRVDEIRLSDPLLADYTIQRYLVESIVQPTAYVVPGYNANLMPTNYGNRLDIQQLADLVSFLESQDQFLDE